MSVAEYLDHTLLKPEASEGQVERLSTRRHPHAGQGV
jgi:deoxyribose-phosphate aldolase